MSIISKIIKYFQKKPKIELKKEWEPTAPLTEHWFHSVVNGDIIQDKRYIRIFIKDGYEIKSYKIKNNIDKEDYLESIKNGITEYNLCEKFYDLEESKQYIEIKENLSNKDNKYINKVLKKLNR